MDKADKAPDSLVARLLQGDPRALARVLSYIEEGDSRANRCIELLFPHTGKAQIIGITGSPGAGKSTLVDRMVASLTKSGRRVGVIAVDPSSPFTGGALLGDRIRMFNSGELSTVFIRSMASRGALGGLAAHTGEAVLAMDAAGFDYVVIETVGVGQSEVEIVRTADCVVVVLVPGMGDTVQVLKAGILEIGDLFAINKADHQGVEQLERELSTLLSLMPKGSRKPDCVRTIATNGVGVEELLEKIASYQDWGRSSGAAERRREEALLNLVKVRVSGEVLSQVANLLEEPKTKQGILKSLRDRKTSPVQVASELLAKYQVQTKKKN